MNDIIPKIGEALRVQDAVAAMERSDARRLPLGVLYGLLSLLFVWAIAYLLPASRDVFGVVFKPAQRACLAGERIAGVLAVEMQELFAVPEPDEERPMPLGGGRRPGRLVLALTD